MSISTDLAPMQAIGVGCNDDTLIVALSDERSISAPLAWFPRLLNASAEERGDWRLIGGGTGVHWPQIDEDISVENLIAGRPSAEKPESLARWLASRGR